ncbi:MAG: hypothetical protein DI551_10380 [Micavibrio aeruginosavorus]|uniref:Ribbon-helix-helix domain-containing protein n=1 Tax=Micavibrio aeruginosavorus TaxID=349221 RepID=A0A2W5MSY0_9BACT|nr:MAG: hypothetical protein DI551_10380 [Micavibrio aeruginosavorus]
MTYHQLQNDTELAAGSTLVSRNITVNGRRTSVRLEPEMWRALKEISSRENCSIHELCSLISFRKNKRTSLTAAIRVFLMLYFRAATTEDGHGRAGHGSFDSMKRRAGWHERAMSAAKPAEAAVAA